MYHKGFRCLIKEEYSVRMQGTDFTHDIHKCP